MEEVTTKAERREQRAQKKRVMGKTGMSVRLLQSLILRRAESARIKSR